MPIRAGEPWGDVGPCPVDAVRVSSNGELWRLVERCRREMVPIPPVALLGGDVMRAVGGTGDERRLAGDVSCVPIDLGRVEADGRVGWFAAHLVARRSWWFGPIVAVMNAEHHGTYDVAPRAHPNDGRFDVVTVDESMSRRDRLRARRRLALGAHVPHPAIEIRRHATSMLTFARPMSIELDGQAWGSARSISVTVEADAFIACV